MKVLYRADGGSAIGTGHLFRASRVLNSLAALRPIEAHVLTTSDPLVDRIGFNAKTTVHCLPPAASSKREAAGAKPQFSASSAIDLIRHLCFDIVVVDMLDTPGSEMRELAAAGIPIVTFDDRGEGRRFATAIINVLVEEPDPMSLPSNLKLLEGASYVALDQAFAEEHDRPAPRSFGLVKRVFVAMGGADSAGLTVKVARSLQRLSSLERVEFVCGPAFPHRANLEAVIVGSMWKAELLTDLPNLIPSFRRCDLAIVAGGLTMYEVCCVGVPALAVCQPIDHQRELGNRLAQAGAMASIPFGMEASDKEIADAVLHLAGDPDRRRAMSLVGPRIVDGLGVDRVARVLIETAERRIG